jgi:DNA-binding NarL/FixJ family response regulator
VVVVEDHTLVRQSLVKTVGAEPGFEVVGEAGRGDEGLKVILEKKPDVALLDIAMPGADGLEVATRIKKAGLGTRIIFLTMHEDDASISRAMALGADGYVTKTASTEELIKALKAVAENGSYLAPAIAKRVIGLAGGRGSVGSLTDRELEILQLMAQGFRPSEVAEKLFVSVKTVKNHLTSIYAKLGVQTGAQAIAEAFRRGLVSAPRFE